MPKLIGLIYDLPENYIDVENNFQLIKNCYPLSIIELFAKIIEEHGFNVKRITSTKELLNITAIGLNDYFLGFINLAQGVGHNFSYAQSALLLEMSGAKYSGNTPFTLLTVRNKHTCKNLLQSAGILSPAGMTVSAQSINTIDFSKLPPKSWIIKPNEGSASDEITERSIVETSELKGYLTTLFESTQGTALIEEFIPGIEVTVFLVRQENCWECYPLMLTSINGELLDENFIYCTNMKTSEARDKYLKWVRPEPFLSTKVIESIGSDAIKIAEETLVKDIVRIDFRVTNDHKIYFIECNGSPHISLGNTIISAINKLYLSSDKPLERRIIESMLHRLSY